MIVAILLLLAAVDAQPLLDTVLSNRAQKDFSLKARLFVTRDQIVPVDVLVKNTATETRTIYRSGTNEVLVIQPPHGPPRTDKLFGSHFTVYDLSLPFLHWPNPKLVGEDRVRGRDCQVVEVKATGQPYARVKLWIDREYHALLRTEAYDENGSLVKRLAITSFKRIGEIWIPRGIEAATVPAGQSLPAEEKSRLEIYDGNYDTQLPAEWFAGGGR